MKIELNNVKFEQIPKTWNENQWITSITDERQKELFKQIEEELGFKVGITPLLFEKCNITIEVIK